MATLQERAVNWNKAIGSKDQNTLIIEAMALISDLVAALPKAEPEPAKKK